MNFSLIILSYWVCLLSIVVILSSYCFFWEIRSSWALLVIESIVILVWLWLFWLDLGVKLSLELGNPVLSFSAPDWQSVVLSYQSLDFWVLGSFIHIDVELSFFSALLSLKFSLINSPLQYSDLLLISFLFLPEANLIIYSASVLTSFVELLNKSFMLSFKCVILMDSWVIVVTKIFHISYFLQEFSFSLLELSNSIGAFLIFLKKLNFMYFYSVHFFG